MKIDTSSPSWLAVAAWAQKQIESKASRLEGPLDPQATDHARGYILALRDLIRYGQGPDPRLVEAQRANL